MGKPMGEAGVLSLTRDADICGAEGVTRASRLPTGDHVYPCPKGILICTKHTEMISTMCHGVRLALLIQKLNCFQMWTLPKYACTFGLPLNHKGFLRCIQCITTLLLSYQNQPSKKISDFSL